MSITLLAVSDFNHELTEFSLNKSLSAHKFDKVVLVCDRPLDLTQSFNFVDISSRNQKMNITDYSDFCIKWMGDYVDTDHVLVTQYDGMAVNNNMWSDEFLDYDYIGPPTNTLHPPIKGFFDSNHIDFLPNYNGAPEWFVGGGGISLRSKKLLNALKDEKIKPFFNAVDKVSGQSHPIFCEDVTICLQYKKYLEQEHNIKFAPMDVGIKFAAEVVTGYNFSFGFHGYENIPFFLSEDECIFYIQNLNKKTFSINHAQANKLRGFLISVGYFKACNALFETLSNKEAARIKKEKEST